MSSFLNDRVILDKTELSILETALDQPVCPKTIDDLNAWIDQIVDNEDDYPEEKLIKAMAKGLRIDPNNPQTPMKIQNQTKKFEAQIIEFKQRT